MSHQFKIQMPFRIRIAIAVAEAAVRGFVGEVLGEDIRPAFLLLSVEESNTRPVEWDGCGRVCRIVLRLEGGYVADLQLMSWGEQRASFGEQWSIQSLVVRAKRLKEGAKSCSLDEGDWEWRSKSFVEGELEGVAHRWWGGWLNTFHPALGRAGELDRVPAPI
jgi:hypothetical protein